MSGIESYIESAKHSMTHCVSIEDLGPELNQTISVTESDSESDKHSVTHSDGIENLKPELRKTTSVTESHGSSTYAEISDGGLLIRAKKPGSSTTSSSSSSGASFDEDFFHIVAKDPGNIPSKLDDDADLSSRDDEKDVPSNASASTGASDPGSARSTHLTDPEYSLHSGSVMQSPPTQLMERSDAVTSYRIPSSVFARSKSVRPLEWSVASNESLFSIHVGNNSFARDHMLTMGRSGELCELRESEELIFPDHKSGELFFPNKSGERLFSSIPPLSIETINPGRKSSVALDDLGIAEAAAETMREVLRAAAEDHNKGKKLRAESHRSDVSGGSFAFPIRKKKKKKCAWPFYYCCKCSRPRCHCKCCKSPSCHCSVCSLPCSHCRWPSCYCANCTRPCSHCTWPSCHCSNCTRPCSHCCTCTRACSHCCTWTSCSCSCSCSKCCRTCSHCCTWPSCSCPNCIWVCSHCCTWPSCSCPKCTRVCSHYCTWPFCYDCSNCCRIRIFCPWPSCKCSSWFGACRHCTWSSCFCCKCRGKFCHRC